MIIFPWIFLTLSEYSAGQNPDFWRLIAELMRNYKRSNADFASVVVSQRECDNRALSSVLPDHQRVLYFHMEEIRQFCVDGRVHVATSWSGGRPPSGVFAFGVGGAADIHEVNILLMVVGLGNPGKKYFETKHNVGFMVLDQLAQDFGVKIDKLEFDAATATVRLNGERVLLVEPQTYMNESGRAVRQLMSFYQIQEDEIIVVQDDLDMPMGKLRLRTKGSAGGHNGIKDIIAATGSSNFARVKVGTDHPAKQTVVDWVLTPFSKDDRPLIDGAVDQAVNLIKDRINGEPISKLMNKYN